MPPPLIYLLPLLLGLMLDRRRRLSFLPRSAARGLGWSLLGGGVALNGWFLRTIREAMCRYAPTKKAAGSIRRALKELGFRRRVSD